MKSKVITLELVNTPDALIRLQELAVKNLKKQNMDEDFLDFQEDILKCLKVIRQMNIVDITGLNKN
ncbi:MAG: hypothetical protein H6Q13_3226 [Bacteroidetes bacterium]|nr:hypothetical protein [Bacteroidota bacterium]